MTAFCSEKKLFEHTNTIVVGVSGGVDSMVLLHMLQRIKLKFNLEIIASHLNHGIRGEEALSDEEFVKSYCLTHGIQCFVEKADIPSIVAQKKESLEAVARDVRYKFLESVRVQFQNAKIVTAHHAEDNAETVLFNILRGTGLAGSSGIAVNSATLCRPMLGIRKSEILEYAQIEGIPFNEDSTNSNTDYTRNFIRLNLLPLIAEQVNPNIVETLNNFAAISGLYNDYFTELTQQVQGVTVEEYDNMIELNLEKIKKLPKALLVDYLRFRVLEKFAVNLVYNSVKKLVDVIDSTILGEIYSDSRLTIEKERDSLLLRTSGYERIESKNVVVPLPGKVEIDGCTLTFEDASAESVLITSDPTIEYFGFEKDVKSLTIRTWKAGDWFKPIGGRGKKKVSDYLTDAKVKHRDRKRVLVVTEGDAIVWLVGLRMDNRYSVTRKTNRIVKATLIYE